jgi:hypothetical protein
VSRQTKQTISQDELLKKIRALLACPECKNIHIDGVEVYREQVNGGNWDITTHRQSGDDHDWIGCRNKIAAGIKKLRSEYDVR